MTMNAEQQYIELFSQTEAMICKHSAEVLNAPRAAAFDDPDPQNGEVQIYGCKQVF